MALFPIVMTAAGAQPRTPEELKAALIALAETLAPGLTANLPAALIEDLASTGTGGLIICDAARVELINSITPFGANAFLLNQLGQIYGVPIGRETNTSVYVVFTGSVGFVIAQGFLVSDGTHQYRVADGGIVGSGGQSIPLFCVATTTGEWSVPIATVTQLVTSVPSTVSLAVTNLVAGTPSTGEQTEESYRSQVLQAGLAASQGMPRFLKTLLQNVDGVQDRLISVIPQTGGGWEILVGGGDPYQVAYAIYTALFDISTLVGSTLSVTAITKAAPGVVTTDLTHGYTTGQVIQINGVVGMTAVNGVNLTVTVVDAHRFSIGVDTTSYATYVSGGVVTPNLRNVEVTINDFPDSYTVPFVNPPLQQVTVSLTWNTISPNFVPPAAVAQLGQPAISAYINSIVTGQPLNLFDMQAVFQAAVVSLIPTQFLTRMVFVVAIDGVITAPDAGTGAIYGDGESYLYAAPSDIAIAQG